MESIQLKDFLNYRFLSSLKHAPGGKRAAFVVANCSEEENNYESRLWLYDGTLRQLTDLGSERSFIWTDEDHILFPAVRSPKEQKRRKAKEAFTSYYSLNIGGGEAVHTFTLPFSAKQIEKAGQGYVALGTIDVNFPDYYKMSDKERADVARHYTEEKDYEVLDELPFWSNGQGMVNKKRTALFTVSSEGQVQRVTEPEFNVTGFVVKDETVFFHGNAYTVKRQRMAGEIRALDLKSREIRLVLAYNDMNVRSIQLVGDKLWLLATESKRYGMNENAWVWELDPVSGERALVRQEEYTLHSSVGSDCRYGAGRSFIAKDGCLYCTTTREGSSHLCRITPEGENIPVVTKEGSIDGFSLCEESGSALLIALYDNKLQELYSADLTTGQVEQISRFNQQVLENKYVAECEPLSTQSQGLTINGWVLRPKDYDPAKSYPAILDIHGGPKTVYGPVFYHEMQLWANMGYFVFFCNIKGSDGRDNKFADIRGHYGEADYRNLMDFTDAVLQRYSQIDQSRVCVTGGSYGGFMTNWIIGHTDRFCCAASQRSISNWISFYGVSDIGPGFGGDQCGADIFDDPMKMWEHSPLRYAGNVKTPTLFIHSDEDYRCPLAEGLQMYTALVQRDVPTRLCMFHGENHELSRSGKPKHRVRRLQEITDWFEKYTK